MSSCTIDIKLKPRAKRDNIKLGDHKLIEISVTSPPIDNKANDHLIRLLSDTLGIPRSSIQIIRGGHSKNKSVAIESLSASEVVKKINSQ